MFDASQSKFHDVAFERLNVDDPQTGQLAANYGVKGIPTVVFLDSGGKALFVGHPTMSMDGWEQMIRQYY